MAATPKNTAVAQHAKRGKGAATVEAARRVEAFIAAYARTGNGTQAAIEAGYSAARARKQGSELLAKRDISARAQEARQAYLDGQRELRERQAHRILTAADDAIQYLHSLVRGENDGKQSQGKVAAAVALIDRAGHKPVDRTELTGANGAPIISRIEIVDLGPDTQD